MKCFEITEGERERERERFGHLSIMIWATPKDKALFGLTNTLKIVSLTMAIVIVSCLRHENFKKERRERRHGIRKVHA